MVDWQSIAVVLIVAGAFAFLVVRVTGTRRRRSPPAETFVPLDQVRKRSDGCH
ncbi:MAG TPA: hypothetical protein VNK41_11515 [Vicinamibacterales bacterium]|nr:hypothetical protein [Vicinamibacterales bacterium]